MKSVKRLLIGLLLCSTVIPGIATAEEGEYVIQKGDTLWGLSSRFLNDPHYWPNLWSKNPQVTNPHFIYPGQSLRFKDGKLEIVETGGQKASAAAPAAAPAQQMVQAAEQEVVQEKRYKVRGNEGWLIASEQEAAGKVIAGQYGRVIFSDNDTIFTDIGSRNGGADGSMYTIMRVSNRIKHPMTGKTIGVKVTPIGTLQLTYTTESNSRAIITKSIKEVEPGDLLIASKPATSRQVPLKMAATNLSGHIAESFSGYKSAAAGDVVYLDLGASQGVEAGNMLYATRKVSIEKMKVSQYGGPLPDEVIGALVVLETTPGSCSALIVKSIDAVMVGDTVVSSAR